MSTNFFDVVLIGNDLAGLVAAAVLSHRGFRVLRLGADAEPDSYRLGRYELPCAPLTFTGLESPAVRRITTALNLVQLLRRRLQPQRPLFQLVLPDARLDITESAEANQREIGREFGAAAVSAFEAYLARAQEVGRVLDAALAQDHALVPDGFWERRELGRWIERLEAATTGLFEGLDEGHPLRAAAALPAAFGSSLQAAGPTLETLARHDELMRRGTFRIEGGRTALRSLVTEQLAGESRPFAARRLVVRRGRVTGVEAGPRDELFGANYVLYAGALGGLSSLLGEDDGVPKSVRNQSATVRIAGYRYVLNAVITAGGIPEGIGSLVFTLSDPSGPLAGANALALHLADPDEEGHVVVSISALLPVPADGVVDPVALARAARPTLEARLAEIMPFWESHRVLLHSPHDGLAPEGIVADPTEPLAMEEIWDSSEPPSLGVGMVAHGSLLKRLIVASRQNLPGLGLEGEFASAWTAARTIAASEKKKDFLRSETLLSRA